MPGYAYDHRLTSRNADQLEAAIAQAPGAVFGISITGVVYSYRPDGDAEAKSEEEIEMEKRAGELAEAFEAAICDLNERFASVASSGHAATMPNTMGLVNDAFSDAVSLESLSEKYPELTDDKRLSSIDMAFGFSNVFPYTTFPQYKARKVLEGVEDWETHSVLRMADVFYAAEADGFSFSEASMPVKEALEAFVNGGDGGGGGE